MSLPAATPTPVSATSSDVGHETSSALRGIAAWAVPVALCALIFAIPFAIALDSARNFTGVAIDGPFQLYNALRRIQAGFRPGIDFQFFHGIGIPYLHYPLYLLFGGRLAGSELARQLVSTLAYPLVFLVVFRAFTGDWRRTWWLTATALAASIALHLTTLTSPLNSMLGLRSTTPMLIPAAFYAIRVPVKRMIVVGLLLGVALFLSTEQGIAMVLAFGIVSACSLLRAGERARRGAAAAGTVVIGAAMFLLLVCAVAGRGTLGVLRYNFRAVPMDQYWYFGAPPNVLISSWSQFLGILIHVRPIGLGVLGIIVATAVCLLRAARQTDPFAGSGGASASDDAPARRADAMALYAVYGLVSCASLLGIVNVGYVQPCWRVLIVLALLALSRVGEPGAIRPRTSEGFAVPRWMKGAAVAAVAWMCFATPSALGILASAPDVIADHVVRRAPFRVGGIWPETMRDDDSLFASRTTPDGRLPSVWSTYAGWLEARHGIFHPSFDYIIHALGPANREQYVERFRQTQPQLVQTVLPTYAVYEAWIEQTSWDFYEELLRRYAVVRTTPWSIFWERQPTDTPPEQLIGEPTIDSTTQLVTLAPVPPTPGMRVTLMTVEVEYTARNPFAFVPLVGANPRFLVGLGRALMRNPVTLDPYVGRARFPLVAVPGSQPTLEFRTFSLVPRASLEVHKVRVFQVAVIPRNAEWLGALVDAESRR